MKIYRTDQPKYKELSGAITGAIRQYAMLADPDPRFEGGVDRNVTDAIVQVYVTTARVLAFGLTDEAIESMQALAFTFAQEAILDIKEDVEEASRK